MAIEITIPRLGWSMDEGVFAGWLKREGDPVKPGDALFSLEGEKSTQDVEAMDAGTLHIPTNGPSVGQVVAVGAVIGHLLEIGETSVLDVAPTAAPTAAPSAEVVASSPSTSAPSRDRPRSSPLARRIAKEKGIDWTTLRGSGSSGRIRRADVMEAIQARAGSPARTAPSTCSIPVTQARRAIAARMSESHLGTAPVTLHTSIDATNLSALRKQFKSITPPVADVPSFGDFLVKLTAIALREYPVLQARWTGGGEMQLAEEANIGVAVDTELGLFVPVIHGAANLGLREIAARSRELIAKARDRRLRPGDTQGGTFTITNLGSFGIETFTPIINTPECAILGVGKIERKPVMDGDRVVGQERMGLSLTFDHRIVDGAPAARFLQHLSRLIENPGPWLMP